MADGINNRFGPRLSDWGGRGVKMLHNMRMRLSEFECVQLKKAVREIAGDRALVRLFGSRAARKGVRFNLSKLRLLLDAREFISLTCRYLSCSAVTTGTHVFWRARLSGPSAPAVRGADRKPLRLCLCVDDQSIIVGQTPYFVAIFDNFRVIKTARRPVIY